MDTSVLDPLVSLVPHAWLPWLVLVPVVQYAAGGLSVLPGLWGVKHPTVWSRFWGTVAAFPMPHAPTQGKGIPPPVETLTPGSGAV